MPSEADTPRDGHGSVDPSSLVRGPLRDALGLLPSGVFLMTACFDVDRSGLRVLSAVQCAEEPVLIAVAARKGHSIEPLIRDSHHFALCVLRPDDRLMLHKFPPGAEPEGGGDPFDGLPHESLASRAPIPRRSVCAFDCEVVRHFDLDADHEIYVGQVLAVKIFPKPAGA